jgi:hypothetical protein
MNKCRSCGMYCEGHVCSDCIEENYTIGIDFAGSRPEDPVAGQTFMDTINKELCFFDGHDWISVSCDGAK